MRINERGENLRMSSKVISVISSPFMYRSAFFGILFNIKVRMSSKSDTKDKQ